ncbi:acyl-CoA dehydrogenase family protein [Streptomyces sp. NBC_01190]|uniref:acyl-CoA dehydrogenase family protein n=1 Tax=Streptomyces sp. NBC_01190 TaxID=2903767 RepID=UPI00386EB78A|nr:acyl-CoA dehydrogenase [Streptomyces sp. NBC_01190]
MTIEATTIPTRQDVRALLQKFSDIAVSSDEPSAPATIRHIWEEAASLGLLAAADAVGPEWRRHSLVIAEEMGSLWLLDLPLWLASDILPTVLRAHGTPRQQELLPGLARGETVISAALTETGNASAFTGLASTARAVDGGYVIDADKRYISNSSLNDYFVISASVSEDRQTTGLFVVPRSTPGIEVTPTSMGHGLELLGTGSVRFTDVRVPADSLLGGVANAPLQLQSAMAMEWFFLALMSNAAAWSAVAGLYERANAERPTGPLLSHSSVQQEFAHVVARLHSVTALVKSLAAGYVETGVVPADLGAVSKVETSVVLNAVLDLESGLRGAADLVATPKPSRDHLDSRRRAAMAQVLAGGANYALNGLTLAGLAARVGKDQIV